MTLGDDMSKKNGLRTFTADCGGCKAAIVSYDGGATWRHANAPQKPCRAYASGVMTEI